MIRATVRDTVAGLESRARLSGGTSHPGIYAAVRDLLRGSRAGQLLDVGCGQGLLWSYVRDVCDGYIGVDAITYEGFPREGRLIAADLERPLPLRDGVADVVASVETIEHLENPRAFVRELVRVVRPGGVVILTTPNQLSALSLLTLLLRQRFAAFQDVHYPAHRTALLEIDLRRIAAEAGLQDVRVAYTLAGRMPLSARHFPRALARTSPRLLSDNVVLSGRRPQE
jgi:2-polyprenyl-3-methyl-5-hydroxy-6-metoxy-1,4-benzoquinol methylase